MLTDAEIAAAVACWRDEGWVLVEGLVPTEAIDAARENLHQLFPEPSAYRAGDPLDGVEYTLSPPVPYSFKRSAAVGPDEGGPAFRLEQFQGQTVFPYPGDGSLNRLSVHPEVRRFVAAALGEADLRLYQARIWAKYQGLANYEQPHHRDGNHSVAPFRAEPGWWHMEGFLYLSDVDEDLAPTHVAGIGPEPGPEVSAAGPRGSYLAYRPDVWHRGVDIERPGGARFLMNLAFRAGGQDWIAFDTVQPRANQPIFRSFAATCDPEDLALFGVPRPGHPFWTAELVEELADRYPGLDVEPWRAALA